MWCEHQPCLPLLVSFTRTVGRLRCVILFFKALVQHAFMPVLIQTAYIHDTYVRRIVRGIGLWE